MAYTKTTWVDRVVQYPNRYDKSGETSSQVTLTASPGTVTTAGTALNATNLNKIENQLELISDLSAPTMIYITHNTSTYNTSYGSTLNANFKWDESFAKGRNVYFECQLNLEVFGSGTAYVRLYNVTDSTQVVELSTTLTENSSMPNIIRSSAISLIHNKYYAIQNKTSNSSYYSVSRNIRLIIL